MTSDEHIRKIFDCENGLTWEQRLDFLLKAVNDISKSLNEAAQSSKLLHQAIGSHNELLTAIFWLIASNFYDNEHACTMSIEDILQGVTIPTKKTDKETHEKQDPKTKISE